MEKDEKANANELWTRKRNAAFSDAEAERRAKTLDEREEIPPRMQLMMKILVFTRGATKLYAKLRDWPHDEYNYSSLQLKQL